MFDFVNNYSALLYLGLFKQYVGAGVAGQPTWDDRCATGSCLPDLMLQLAIIFCGKQFYDQLIEVFFPYVFEEGVVMGELCVVVCRVTGIIWVHPLALPQLPQLPQRPSTTSPSLPTNLSIGM